MDDKVFVAFESEKFVLEDLQLTEEGLSFSRASVCSSHVICILNSQLRD